MNKKVLLIWSSMFALIILDACNGINCNCGGVIPFFDFEEIELFSEQNIINSNESFSFQILPKDVEYLASQATSPCKMPFFITTANACTCIPDGEEGMKFPVESVNLTSNANWTDSLSSGSDLSDLLQLDLRMIGEFKPLNETFGDKLFFTPYSASHFRLVGEPAADSLHVFTFEFVKNNGETFSVQTDSVRWE